MSALYVIDTHALFWYLVNSPRLSPFGRQVFQKAFAGETSLVLSPIVLLELYGLAQNLEAPFDFAQELDLFEHPPFRIEPLTSADLRLLDSVSSVTELHDRLIAATALRLNAPVLTRDPLISACNEVASVW